MTADIKIKPTPIWPIWVFGLIIIALSVNVENTYVGSGVFIGCLIFIGWIVFLFRFSRIFAAC